MNKSYGILCLVILFFSGCTSIDYFGKTYPPTTQVDLYFSKADINKEYEVMGSAIETAADFVSEEKMQDALRQKGCSVGADAILIESFKRIKVGENTDISNFESGETRKHSHHHHKRETYTNSNFGTENTNYVTERQIKASFLKYRK
jgi:hypothetical protein